MKPKQPHPDSPTNVAPTANRDACPASYEFGPFQLESRTHLLFRDGDVVHLTPKVLEVLFALVEAHGQLVEKNQLLKAVWPDCFVEEGNLSQTISILRKSLGETPDGGQYIETIPTRGYRFAARIREIGEENASSIKNSLEPTRGGSEPVLREWRKRKNIAIGILLTVCLVAALLIRSQNSAKTPGVTSIAVLPFLNLSADSGNEYISDGLTEEVISQLAQIKGLRIVARTSVFQFKNRNSDIRSVGKQLKAQCVLEGSVRRERSRLRVTVHLDKASDGYHLWSHTYDNEFSNVFAIQEEIAQSIVDSLGENLQPAVRGSKVKRHTSNSEAYDLYLKGLYQKGKVSRAAMDKAIDFFKQAIALDPGFAAPHAGLAHSYIALGYSFQMPPKEAYPQALKQVQRALAIDDSLADAHASAAIIHLAYDWDWQSAQREFERALTLDPACALAHHWYSHYFVVMNRFDASLVESRRALELEPLDLPISAHIGWHYMFARQYDRAVAELLKSIELEPNQYWSWGFLRMAYEQESELGRAITVLGRSNTDPKYVATLRRELAKHGAEGYWRTRLTDALAHPHENDGQPYYVAQIFVHLHDRNGALEWLNRGYESRDSLLIYLKMDPAWDPIRSDPRFIDLAKRVGVP